MSVFIFYERARERDLSPTCLSCRHLIFPLRLRRCRAFPEGVPSVIWDGDNDHREPFLGDNGVRFEELTEADHLERRRRTDELRQEWERRMADYRARAAERKALAVVGASAPT